MEQLNTEDKIMGRKKPLPKTDLELKAFTKETKYKIKTIGRDNESIINGEDLSYILNHDQKFQITSGDIEIETNCFKITRIIEETRKRNKNNG